MEEDTMLLHSIVLMYAPLYIRRYLVAFFRYDLVAPVRRLTQNFIDAWWQQTYQSSSPCLSWNYMTDGRRPFRLLTPSNVISKVILCFRHRMYRQSSLPANAYVLQYVDEDGIVLSFHLSQFHCQLNTFAPRLRL